tara:strand:+ start:221 stop:463 length:243 start_codon:yes stop_codon:yes gene_type:complete
MVRLKNYVDFITSLVEMDEVKKGLFVLPTNIEFNLDRSNHRELKKEVIKTKGGDVVKDELADPFELDILGVNLTFEHNEK